MYRVGLSALAQPRLTKGGRSYQAAAGRPRVGAWLRRALRGGVHDESCPYHGSPCGERMQFILPPATRGCHLPPETNALGQHVVLSLPHLFHGARAMSSPIPHQSVTPAKIRPKPMKPLRM